MRPTLGTGEAQGYAAAMAGLWPALARTLRRLEAIAAVPETHLGDDAVVRSLPGLQYALHTAGELVHGIEPPPQSEWEHAELAAALADARDATAEIGEASEEGGVAAALPLVAEWRGALFRVRLARLRVTPQPPRAPLLRERPPDPRIDPAALTATLLALVGTLVVTTGAVLGLWPLWALGLALVAGGLVVYRP